MLNLKKVTRKSSNKKINHLTYYLANSPWIQLAVIILMIIILTYNHYCVIRESCNNSGEISKLARDYKQVCSQLRTLRQKHSRLLARVKENAGRLAASFLHNISFTEALGPTEEYETLRRSIYFNLKELWYCVQTQLQRVDNKTHRPVRWSLRRGLVDNVADRKRWLLVQQEQLADIDGFSEWRRQEALDVSNVVQQRLWFLQNPVNCRGAKKLTCTHNQGGFGCKHHHLMFCLMYAYSTKRTLILSESSKSNYKAWTDVFYHLSENCNTAFSDRRYIWRKWNGASKNDERVLYMPVMNLGKVLQMKPLLLPYFIPKDLAKRISRFNSDPEAWWAGQMLRYLLKPRPYVKHAIYLAMQHMNLTYLLEDAGDRPPMVGIHVRWTDKHRETPLYSIKSYMTHVEDYFLKLEITQNVPERRVYIATDDMRVLLEANLSYPNYKFFGSATRADLASVENTRYTEAALNDLMVDMHVLTLCDYVIGTFSSNFGKMAYELMHTTSDATHRFHSLDDSYFMSSSTLEPHYRQAVQRHRGHPTFEIGDIIKHYYFQPGSIGKVERTLDHGPMPWYKTDRHLSTYTAPRIERLHVYIEDASNTSEENPDFNFNFDIPRKLLTP